MNPKHTKICIVGISDLKIFFSCLYVHESTSIPYKIFYYAQKGHKHLKELIEIGILLHTPE